MSAKEVKLEACPWCSDKMVATEYPGGLYAEHAVNHDCPATTMTVTVDEWNRRAPSEDRRDGERYRWLRDKSAPEKSGFYLATGEQWRKFEPSEIDRNIDLSIELEKGVTLEDHRNNG